MLGLGLEVGPGPEMAIWGAPLDPNQFSMLLACISSIIHILSFVTRAIKSQVTLH